MVPALVLLVAVSCAGGSLDLASAESAARGQDAVGSEAEEDADGGEAEEGPATACERLVALEAEGDGDEITEPEELADAAEQLRDASAGAPEDVVAAMEVISDLLDELAELGEKEGLEDGIEQMMQLFLDPDLLAATEVVSAFLTDECGLSATEAEAFLDPNFLPEPFDEADGADGAGSSGTGDEAALRLDDLDALKEANEGEAWVAKMVSTTVLNGTAVALAAPPTGEGGVEPLTVEEALAACEAVRVAYEDTFAELEVEVLNGDTPVASGAAGVACTAP